MKEFIFGLLLGIGLTLSIVKVREKLEEPPPNPVAPQPTTPTTDWRFDAKRGTLNQPARQ